MTDGQRTDIRGETLRGAKEQQGAQMSQESVDANIERDSSAGSVDPGGWKGVNDDEKVERKNDNK